MSSTSQPSAEWALQDSNLWPPACRGGEQVASGDVPQPGKLGYVLSGPVVTLLVPRRRGKPVESLVDAADLPTVLDWPGTWAVEEQGGKCFVISRRKGAPALLLHRLILGAQSLPRIWIVRHANGDGLDNRKANLQLVQRVGSGHPRFTPNSYEVRGDVTALRLPAGRKTHVDTLIDTTDLSLVVSSGNTWRASRGPYTSYAVGRARRDGHETSVKLHRFILGAPDGVIVDHIDHDGLNNRRANLRLTDQTGNMLNRRGPTCRSQSGFRGVVAGPRPGDWKARVQVEGKVQQLGVFSSKEAAAEAVRRRVAELLRVSRVS